MRKKIDNLMLAGLDTFLIMYFPLLTGHLLEKRGITSLNAMETLEFSLILIAMPAICKYLALKINKEKENIGRQVMDSLFHIISGYIVYFITLNIVINWTKSPMIVYPTIALMLIIMYLLFGEYNFSFNIISEEERICKNKITKEVLGNKDVNEFLIDKAYDEAKVDFTFEIIRNENGKLDVDKIKIDVEKKGEIIEEDESFKESDK